MSSTLIRVDGRPFYVALYALQAKSEYVCHFHEKYETFGRVWGYRTWNKNTARKERDEIYDWFKTMVENNLPQDESDTAVLREVIEKLDSEFEEVERNA